jgi:hypothetical protein
LICSTICKYTGEPELKLIWICTALV